MVNAVHYFSQFVMDFQIILTFEPLFDLYFNCLVWEEMEYYLSTLYIGFIPFENFKPDGFNNSL